ncbi:MAG: biotin/lipoyl-containing protein, partial [Cellulosimicrobium funkei]
MTALREFRLPDLGEGLTESDIVSWHVHAGDRVELNQVIAEVETAKALVDLPSPYAGVVASLHAEEGQTVSVGEPLVTFEVDDGAAPASGGGAAPVADGAAAPGSAEVPARVPDAVPALVGAVAEVRAAPAATAADPADAPEPNLVGYGARPD